MLTGILLHGFGQRYDLPISLALYLYAAAGVVVISFVLVVLFAGEQVGAKALEYPRRPVAWLTAVARWPWPRFVGGVLGVAGLVAIVVCGFLGSTNPQLNPAEYITWIYFWAALVILSGLVGNLWYLVNPWASLYDAVGRIAGRGGLHPLQARGASVEGPPQPVGRMGRMRRKLPDVGVWPAAVAYFAFACLELTTGMANRPWLVATVALVYSVVTLAGMSLFGRDAWLEHCEGFTVLFGIVGRFGPMEAERDGAGRITAVYLRPWGVGLLKPSAAGWDRVVFVILMLSTLAFDGILATPSWQDFTIALDPIWLPMGVFGFFFVRTLGLVLLSVAASAEVRPRRTPSRA